MADVEGAGGGAGEGGGEFRGGGGGGGGRGGGGRRDRDFGGGGGGGFGGGFGGLRRDDRRKGTRCRFCREQAEYIDYKDLQALSKQCNAQGKLFSRKRSGNCAKHQRMVKVAVKRARYMALLAFVG